MSEWVQDINQKLVMLKSPSTIIDWYGHTGNFVVESSEKEISNIAVDLTSVIGVSFAVLPYGEVERLIAAAGKSSAPSPREGKRWTCGMVFAVKSPPCVMVPKQTSHALFFALTDRAVGAWKEDQLKEDGALDPERRGGGWGAVSGDVSKTVGGVWTARSLRTVIGTFKKAQEMLQGAWTASAARLLSDKYDSHGFDVLCAHQDRRSDRTGESRVRTGQIVCWAGSDFKSSSRLTFPDIAVLDRRSKKVILLAEVEERKASPKLVVADFLATLIGDHLTFGANHAEELHVGSWTNFSVLVRSTGIGATDQRLPSLATKLDEVRKRLSTPNSLIGQLSLEAYRSEIELRDQLVTQTEKALNTIGKTDTGL
jgi:hypothetical protein